MARLRAWSKYSVRLLIVNDELVVRLKVDDLLLLIYIVTPS